MLKSILFASYVALTFTAPAAPPVETQLTPTWICPNGQSGYPPNCN